MADTDKSDAENHDNAEEIKRMDATQHGARGNVHSEPDKQPTEQEPPPPLPS